MSEIEAGGAVGVSLALGGEATATPGIGRAVTFAIGVSVFLVYLGMLVVGVVAHEPWFDEAQSWLLARDATVRDLLTTYLRYEGHPPLWYLILAVPAKLGLPYKSINVVSAAIGAWGVALLLVTRTVPLAIRLLLPFTYFVAYQYTIVSRSYVLILPLLLLVLRLYPERRQRLARFTLLLVLLSLVSLHGMSLAGALTLLYLIDLWPQRSSLSKAEIRSHAIAAGVLLTNVALVALVLRPPADLAIRSKLDLRFSPESLLGIGWTGLTNNLFGPNFYSAAALALFVLWFRRTKTLAAFLLLVGSLLPISTVYFNRWHEGLFFLALFFTVLLAAAKGETESTPPSDRWLGRAALLLVSIVLIQHVVWTVRSLRYDIASAFSGSQEAAEFIAANHVDQKRLFGSGFPALAVQPYFDRNVFANYTTKGGFSFWDWSTGTPWFYRPAMLLKREDMDRWMTEQIGSEPDYFLVSRKFVSDAEYGRLLRLDGHYELARVFLGAHSWKGEPAETETYELYARTR